MTETDLSPLMRQYRDVKHAYHDAIVFFRVGDFYEMFYEDAEIASRLLNIALTSRDKTSAPAGASRTAAMRCSASTSAVSGATRPSTPVQSMDGAVDAGLTRRDADGVRREGAEAVVVNTCLPRMAARR